MKNCSLTIVCVIVGVVIFFMLFSGSNDDRYGLIEGLEMKKAKKKESLISKAMDSASSTHKLLIPGGIALANNKKTEGFEVRQPIEFSNIVESKGDSWNLSKWVKNATRYSKGMGTENKLDSYKYNSGPPIPLPEGELFFFANTKFDPESCPSTYSNSQGCAAMSLAQYNYLTTRAGNHTVPKNTNTSYYNEF